MQITIVAGARPNFVKIAPIIEEIEKRKLLNPKLSYRLVHTGQHYDKKMSDDFFEQLGIPEPHVNLGAGSGSPAEQTAAIMIKFERELINNPAELVLVVGDVTSTMACAIVAQKLQIKVGHVEGGIRSGDWSMPEEINRIVTDSISNFFFTTSTTANANLIASGVDESRIFFVGNTMIDTLLKQMPNFKRPAILDNYDLHSKDYIVLTLHRPSNVDNFENLKILIETIVSSANGVPIIFPVHPRTASSLKKMELDDSNIHLIEPLSYLEFNYLVKHALAVMTDSGGITEEATILGIPCMTLRDSTERPETCTIGTNLLLGSDPNVIPEAFEKLFSKSWKAGGIPELWDGHAASRIIDNISTLYNLDD